MKRSLASRIRDRERLVGTMLSLPSPEVAELLAGCGFDWLMIDQAHGPAGALDVQRMLQAARAPALVRVPGADPAAIQQALDTGAEGVIIPGIDNAGQCARAVAACRYPPLGRRAAGIARAHRYGLEYRGYLNDANLEVVIVPQIGTLDALQDLEAIATVAGVSALFVDPLQLEMQLAAPLTGEGEPVEEEGPTPSTVIARLKQVCEEADLPMGLHAADADGAARWMGAGFNLVAVAGDAAMLAQRGRNLVQLLK